MTIRNYLPSDELGVREILLSNIPNGYFVIEDMKILDNWIAAQNKGVVAYPPAVADHFFVLEAEKVIGCAGFYVLAEEKRAHLTWGMLQADFHKKGYGKLLFQHRVNKIKEQYPGFDITVWTSQYTFKFFEKLGMKIESITPNGYGYNYDKYSLRLLD